MFKRTFSDELTQIRRLRESRVHTLTVFLTSLAGIALWVAAVVYFKVQERKGAPIWTLWSWSCTHEDWTNGKMSFKSMCTKLVSFSSPLAGVRPSRSPRLRSQPQILGSG